MPPLVIYSISLATSVSLGNILQKRTMKKNPRIIAGSAKGQRLDVPQKGTRPMSDRAKSALFSMIFDFIPKANVLDLFAGTGALGIECLSRGAAQAVFVDRSRHAIDVIHKNLDKTGFSSLAHVIKSSAIRFVDEYDKFDIGIDRFDIIFFAPPYADFKESVLERTLFILEPDGIVVAEHDSRMSPPEDIAGLALVDQRSYGRTGLSFYRRATKSLQ